MAVDWSLLYQRLLKCRYKHYERWATANDFPVENIINDGTTTYGSRLGAVADVELAIRSRGLQDDVMVVGNPSSTLNALPVRHLLEKIKSLC